MLLSDVKIGAFVSGGIDSSLIAQEGIKNNNSLKLFTADVTGSDSEIQYARLLSKELKANLHEYQFDYNSFLSEWAEATYFYELPIITHVNAIPLKGVTNLASQNGVKPVLTGEGADELFLGYPRLFTDEYLKYLELPYKVLDKFFQSIPQLNRVVKPKFKSDKYSFSMLKDGFHEYTTKEFIKEKYSFLSKKERKYAYVTFDLLERKLVSLLHRNDRMGMAASIESRFPFLDENILKFSLNLPIRYKGRWGLRSNDLRHPFLTDKWIVREKGNELPKSLKNRKKAGFPTSIYKRLRFKKDFFNDSFIKEHFKLSKKEIKALLNYTPAYHLSKLAALNIFGEIFFMNKSRKEVTEKIKMNTELNVN